jgi:hypothetical protein
MSCCWGGASSETTPACSLSSPIARWQDYWESRAARPIERVAPFGQQVGALATQRKSNQKLGRQARLINVGARELVAHFNNNIAYASRGVHAASIAEAANCGREITGAFL